MSPTLKNRISKRLVPRNEKCGVARHVIFSKEVHYQFFLELLADLYQQFGVETYILTKIAFTQTLGEEDLVMP